jgi:hypothetical protein
MSLMGLVSEWERDQSINEWCIRGIVVLIKIYFQMWWNDTYSANVRRHSRKLSRSSRSNSSALIFKFQRGLRRVSFVLFIKSETNLKIACFFSLQIQTNKFKFSKWIDHTVLEWEVDSIFLVFAVELLQKLGIWVLWTQYCWAQQHFLFQQWTSFGTNQQCESIQ